MDAVCLVFGKLYADEAITGDDAITMETSNHAAVLQVSLKEKFVISL
jgi:hypothetical protein